LDSTVTSVRAFCVPAAPCRAGLWGLLIYPVLGGRYGRPKGVLSSGLWSYTGIAGMYFPFTGEAT